jgi:hypothetical protein
MNNSLIPYLSSGIQRFKTMPIIQHTRRNWEFYCVVEGRCGVLLDGDEKLPLRTRRLWVFPPGHLHGWHGEEAHCSVVVVHAAIVPSQLAEAISPCGILGRRLTTLQCRQVENLERALETDFHSPNALSELKFKRAIINLTVIALGGDIAALTRSPRRRIRQSTNMEAAYDANRPGDHPGKAAFIVPSQADSSPTPWRRRDPSVASTSRQY